MTVLFTREECRSAWADGRGEGYFQWFPKGWEYRDGWEALPKTNQNCRLTRRQEDFLLCLYNLTEVRINGELAPLRADFVEAFGASPNQHPRALEFMGLIRDVAGLRPYRLTSFGRKVLVRAGLV